MTSNWCQVLLKFLMEAACDKSCVKFHATTKGYVLYLQDSLELFPITSGLRKTLLRNGPSDKTFVTFQPLHHICTGFQCYVHNSFLSTSIFRRAKK